MLLLLLLRLRLRLLLLLLMTVMTMGRHVSARSRGKHHEPIVRGWRSPPHILQRREFLQRRLIVNGSVELGRGPSDSQLDLTPDLAQCVDWFSRERFGTEGLGV